MARHDLKMKFGRYEADCAQEGTTGEEPRPTYYILIRNSGG